MPTLPKPNESKNFAPAPNGPHPAACFRIIDLGTQEDDFKGKKNKRRKIVISWELFSEERMEDGLHDVFGIDAACELWRTSGTDQLP